MIVANVEQVKIADFSAGFGSNINLLAYPKNMSPDCLNVCSKQIKALQKRNGYTEVSDISDVGYGLIEWPDVDGVGSVRMISLSGTVLKYRDNLTGSWTTAAGATFSANVQYEFTFSEKGGSRFLLMTDWDRGTLKQLNVAGATAAVSGTPPRARHCINWENYIWVGNLSDGTSDLRYSALADYESWPAANRETLTTQYGDQVRGFAILKKRLYVFKDYSIHRYSYLGGSPLFQKDSLYGIGTVSSKTIQEVDIPGTGKALMFLGTDGRVYVFDGYNPPQDVSDVAWYNNNTKVNLARMNFSQIENACAVNYPDQKWYVLFFPVGGGLNTVGMIFDYGQKPISIWPFTNHRVSSANLLTKTTGVKRIYFIDDAAKLMEFDIGNSDNGDAIDAFWTSPRYEIDSAQMLKQGYQVTLFNKLNGRFTLDFKWREGWQRSWNVVAVNQYSPGNDYLGESFILGTSKLGSSSIVSNVVDLPLNDNAVQFQIADNSSNTPFTIFKLEALAETKGVG